MKKSKLKFMSYILSISVLVLLFQNCGSFEGYSIGSQENQYDLTKDHSSENQPSVPVDSTGPIIDPNENLEDDLMMEPEVNIDPPIVGERGGAKGPLLAVPGAIGGGKNTTGGRGYPVVIVDTLSMAVNPNDGVTSFAEAVASGNKTVVFSVSGVIGSGKDFNLEASNITIACHTAPGKGIAFKFNRFVLNGTRANNIIMRHCRFRATDPADYGGSSDNGRGFMLGYGANNVYIDHMSVSWGTDATLQIYLPQISKEPVRNVSVVNSFIAEGDTDSSHSQSKRFPFYHSMGASCLNGNSKIKPHAITYANNFLAHNGSRNYATNSCQIEFLNSIIYNWVYSASVYTNTLDTEVKIKNNLYVKGPNTIGASVPECGNLDYNCPFVVYKKGMNSLVKDVFFSANNLAKINNMALPPYARAGTEPNFLWGAPSPIPIKKMAEKGSSHTNCVGASVPMRDAIDKRIMAEFYNGNGRAGISSNGVRDYSFYTSSKRSQTEDSDQDGMLDSWERSNNLNVGLKDSHLDHDNDGYTNIEEFFADIDNCQ